MSLRRTRLRPSLRISSFGNQVELLHQGQVVLDVPVVGDAPVGDAVDVGGDEIDRLALALGLPEAAGEVAGKRKGATTRSTAAIICLISRPVSGGAASSNPGGAHGSAGPRRAPA